jgi:hypothetical protein
VVLIGPPGFLIFGKTTPMLTDVIKTEQVGYLKSSMNLMQGVLYLTRTRLVLEAHKTGVGGGGLLGFLLKKKVESKKEGFDMELKDIAKIAEGKHGLAKGILEVSDNAGNTYRLMVKNYADWETLLKQ